MGQRDGRDSEIIFRAVSVILYAYRYQLFCCVFNGVRLSLHGGVDACSTICCVSSGKDAVRAGHCRSVQTKAKDAAREQFANE